jgi:enterochelin esterase-like enzyme
VDENILSAVKNFSEGQLLQLYHVIGNQETEVQTTDGSLKDFLTPNRELSKIISEKPITYFYEEFNGNHTWTYWQPDLRRALKMLF